ncbi:MAG: D-alanyl-D-alanine carboxypeptidase [Actinomycetota bacterium]|jgi:D-alanyl-D-alanine carboxypeptidase|nr:D-alanyl-D-alanine carboxypeptidase [Actinomycetota bacterium]
MALTLVPPGHDVTAAVATDNRVWTSGPALRFRAASVTKTFVAATALVLAERGLLDVAQPTEELLDPELLTELVEGGYDPGRITVEHLLGHRAGLPDHSTSATFTAAVRADPGHVWTRAEQLAIALGEGGPLGVPGAVVHYSDTGYVLIGDILERVCGRPLGDVVADALDLAIRTPDTVWEVEQVAQPRFPQRVDATLDVWHIDASVDLFGGGGLVSTARDLAVFGRDLLTGRVLSTNALDRLLAHGLGIVRAPGPAELWGHLGFWGTAMLGSSSGIGIGVAVSPAPIGGGCDPGGVALRLHAALLDGQL